MSNVKTRLSNRFTDMHKGVSRLSDSADGDDFPLLKVAYCKVCKHPMFCMDSIMVGICRGCRCDAHYATA